MLNSIPPSPLHDRMGIQILSARPEAATAAMPVEGNTQPAGFLHGGATATLIESVASVAAWTYAQPVGKIPVGVDLNVTHLASVTVGSVTATATAVLLGRGTVVYTVEVRDAGGRVTAVGRLTCRLIKTPPADKND